MTEKELLGVLIRAAGLWFVGSGFIFQPKFIFGNAGKAEMLAEISELLIEIRADESSINSIDF